MSAWSARPDPALGPAAAVPAGAVPAGAVPAGAVLLATRNPGKLRELQPLFADWGVRVLTLDELGIAEVAAEADLECFSSFAANAMAKARYFHAKCGGVVLAEDSGLCVAALNGAPGVHSKRWGAAHGSEGLTVDERNIRLLLTRLDGAMDRRAHYFCAAALVWTGGAVVGSGRTDGRIVSQPVGDGGFGYDPVFWSRELDACFSQVSPAAKASVSHRSEAVRRAWEAAQPLPAGAWAAVGGSNSGRPVDRSRGAM